MTTAASSRSARSVTRVEWVALLLLVVSVGINYIDRGNLSVAGVALKDELHLNGTQLGWLLSAFFWTYAGFQILSGWLIDRYNVVWVYAAGYFIWSSATLLTGTVNGFAMLFGLRLFLGMSESVAYPSYSKIIAAGFPERQRGIANGLVDAGSKLGPAMGVLVGGMLLSHVGWRWLFILIGGASMLWLIPWAAIAGHIRTGASAHLSEGRTDTAGFGEILRQRDAWGSFLGLFCGNYGWYFLLTWLPQYFILERHYSNTMMAQLGSVPFWSIALGAILGGFISDRWIDSGASPTLVRKTFVAGGLTLFAFILLPAAMVKDQTIALWLLSAASFCLGLFSSNHWAITQTLAGTAAAGKWTGIQNMCGNVSGIVVPVVTGRIYDATGHFFWAFVCVCSLVLIGALSYLVIVRRIEPVSWHA
jgi:ACS family D-galactonate transporter-like MFS transporter